MFLACYHVNWCVDELFYEDDSVLTYARGRSGLYGIVGSDFEFEFCVRGAGVLDRVSGPGLYQGPVGACVSRAD